MTHREIWLHAYQDNLRATGLHLDAMEAANEVLARCLSLSNKCEIPF